MSLLDENVCIGTKANLSLAIFCVSKIVDNKIEILSPCTQELTAYIKNAYGCEIIAYNVGLSKSEEVILNEK